MNLHCGSLRALSAMRCSFVPTASLFPGIIDVSLQHCYSCGILSSSGITRLPWYYDAIRLPLPLLPFFLCYRLAGILALLQESRGPPGLPHIHYVRHAMVSDPGETSRTLPLSLPPMLTSANATASSLPTISFEAQSLQPYGLRPACSLSYA